MKMLPPIIAHRIVSSPSNKNLPYIFHYQTPVVILNGNELYLKLYGNNDILEVLFMYIYILFKYIFVITPDKQGPIKHACLSIVPAMIQCRQGV